ncbi:MAG: GNAT family N-acetyltransferase [Acidobacteriota bacterium]
MTSEVHIRKMTQADIPTGMHLKEIAGWNQVEADWAGFLEIEPEGCFVAEVAGQVVATTTAIQYSDWCGWIGMVIVDPAFRGHGIATLLVKRGIDYLESRSCQCQKLDATDAGAKVYEKMGFLTEYRVERWRRDASLERNSEAAPLTVEPLTSDRLLTLADLDRAAFGADRFKLLSWYCQSPAPRFLSLSGHGSGFVMGRPGSKALQMGPLVAENPAVARGLIRAFLEKAPHDPIIADVIPGHNEGPLLLEQFGFTRQRVLLRMYRGRNLSPGNVQQTFCLAGFEFG